MSPAAEHPKRGLILAGGNGPEEGSLPTHVARGTYVVAADSGLDRANALGIAVNTLIGDLDSVTAEALKQARRSGVEIIAHERDKDETDLELAIGHCIDSGIEKLTVMCIAGGRIDHEFANLMVLCSASWKDAEITAVTERGQWLPVHSTRTVPVGRGATVTLMPIGGRADNVSTTGFRWNLDDETLWPGSSRGVSNVATDQSPTVSVGHGVVLAIVPWQIDR